MAKKSWRQRVLKEWVPGTCKLENGDKIFIKNFDKYVDSNFDPLFDEEGNLLYEKEALADVSEDEKKLAAVLFAYAVKQAKTFHA